MKTEDRKKCFETLKKGHLLRSERYYLKKAEKARSQSELRQCVSKLTTLKVARCSPRVKKEIFAQLRDSVHLIRTPKY